MNRPPQLANRLLHAFCNPEFIEMIEGDLNEEYVRLLSTRGKRKAVLNYWWTVIRSIRPYLLKRKNNPYKYSEPMLLKNYLKISYRNLIKQKLYTAINILGLTAGIASSLLIFLFVRSEMTFDRYHKDVDRIYRVTTEGKNNEETMVMTTSPLGLAYKMQVEFPEVEVIARLSPFIGEDRNLMIYGDKKIFQENGYLADSAFFKILTYHFVEGDPNTCLNNSGAVVLSSSVAKKLFGNEPALDKLISIQNSFGRVDYSVTGVFEDPEQNTHLNISFVTSMNNPGLGAYIYKSDELLGNNFVYTYLKLRPGAKPDDLVKKFPSFLDKYVGKQMEEMGFHKSHNLIWVPDIHLKAEGLGFQKEGDVKTLYILSTIALVILVIACINFMNMATAQAGYRSMEIGVRKVFGAQRISLATQFLVESVLITLVSLVASVVIVYWMVPVFNGITGKRISFDLFEPAQILIALGIGIITGFLAGSYPAFYLSRISITRVFRKHRNKSGTGMVRKSLVVFQFLISISLIAAVITINNQLQFVQSKSLGFKKENQIAIPLRSPDIALKYQTLKNEIRPVKGISSIAAGMAYPGKFVFNDNGFYKEGKSMNDAINIRMNYVDYDFMNTLGVDVINGRGFSKIFREMSTNA